MSDLVERLRNYNPPDRTIDSQRQMAQDIHDAAAEIARLRAAPTSEEVQKVITRLRNEAQDGGPYHLCHDAADLLESLARQLAAAQERIAQLEGELRVRPGANEIADMNEHIDQQDEYIARLEQALQAIRQNCAQLMPGDWAAMVARAALDGKEGT